MGDPLSVLLEIGAKAAWRSVFWAIVIVAVSMLVIGITVGWFIWG